MNHDEEMQNRIASGKIGETADELAYQAVFKALAKEQPSRIAPGLADRVILRLEKRKEERKSSFDLIMAIVGGLLFIAGFIVTLVVTGFRPDFGFLEAIADFKGLFLFGIAFIIVINIIDKQLMRKKRMI
jgi:hypothetical protein